MQLLFSGAGKYLLPLALAGALGYHIPNLPVSALYVRQSSPADSTQKDTVSYTRFKDLPLKPERKIRFSTDEGTWMSVDVSPDGKTLAFDLMGDIYTLPMEGGKATPVTRGMAYETHPRFSPDGKKLLFTSDRSGSDNIWYIDFEKQDTIQLTKDRTDDFPSAVWTPDGNYIIASKGRRIPKLWMYHKNGGGGIQLNDQPAGIKTIDPFVSPDGKTIYFSQRTGAWNYNALLPQYQIGTFDREKGRLSTITTRHGSAFTPTLSKDGQWLAYGSRHEDKTGLILRNLHTGDERWLAYPVQRDEQESIAPMGVLPGMSFTPDSKYLVASFGGKIWKLPVDGSPAIAIPFQVDMELELGPRLYFNYPIKDTSQQLATQIRDAVPSPDGKRLAFTVLNRLFVMDWPNGTPRRVTNHDFTEAMPAWSPDGNQLAFVSWEEKEGGHLHVANLSGKGSVRKLTTEAAFYTSPAWSYHNRIAFFRGPRRLFKDAESPFYSDAEGEIVWIDPRGGSIHYIDKSRGRGNLHFTRDTNRIFLNTADGSLISIRWDGTDEKTHVKVSGITPYGTVAEAEGHPHNRQFVMGRNMLSASPLNHCMLPESSDMREPQPQPAPAEAVLMAPVGNRAIAKVTNNLYVITLPPPTGKVPSISVADPRNAAFPSRQLTEIGGEFPAWEANGSKVHWSLGNGHWVYDVDAAEAFEDSVKTAKKAAERRKADSLQQLSKLDSVARAAIDSIAQAKAKADTSAKSSTAEEPAYKPMEVQVKVYFPKDIPTGTLLLKNGRVITMRGDEVIERGDVLIVNNRIVAVGKTGTLQVPAGAKEIDCTGKTIMPGFVDTHAHMWPFWGIHKNQVWIYAANLAYGVTTTRDPQTATTDVLTYGDMVDAGLMVGPRIYSTGPGVGFWAYNLKDLAQTRNVLKQYSKYYNTKTIKMYLVGNRQQRQWVIQAAKEQQLMPTTEGGLDFKLNMTQLLDGYPGHEHALPIFPLFKDVTKTIAEAKMTVTPTLLVAYGGPWAENYYYTTEKVFNDPKLQYFTPYEELAAKSRRRVGNLGGWFIREDHVFSKHAQGIKSLVEQGGLAGIGSHGQLQGLGYHWELWSVASGGMSNLQALQVATLHGATAIGLDKDLGSLEAGKLADVLVMDGNPLENIRHTNTLRWVIKNGRMYDANTLDEVYPNPRPLNREAWRKDTPVVNTPVVQ